MSDVLTPEQLASARATYEQRVQANAAWQATLAERDWTGYITILVGTLYRASKVVRGVGVELAGDSPEDVLAAIERIEGRRALDDQEDR